MVFRLNVLSLYGFIQERPVAFSMNALNRLSSVPRDAFSSMYAACALTNR